MWGGERLPWHSLFGRTIVPAMHIVVVEDNLTLAKSIGIVLKREGYATTLFAEGEGAYCWLSANPDAYDMLILDIVLPGMDGYAICRRLRHAGSSVPILLLTSKNAPTDIVTGLDSGADDYVKKPFVFAELLARIRTLTRRALLPLSSVVTLNPELQVDLLARKVFKEGAVVHLTAKEFALLQYFLDHPNQLLTQQALYDHVFDFAEVQLSNTIEVHIKNLRKKLKTDHFAFPLSTIRNAGYRLDR